MKLKEITDIYNKIWTIDITDQKIVGYSNKKNYIRYNAEIVEDGKRTGQRTEYIVNEKLDDVDLKIESWNSEPQIIYSNLVKYNATENDPNKAIWNRLVNYVKGHPDIFYDELGDEIHGVHLSKESEELILGK